MALSTLSGAIRQRIPAFGRQPLASVPCFPMFSGRLQWISASFLNCVHRCVLLCKPSFTPFYVTPGRVVTHNGLTFGLCCCLVRTAFDGTVPQTYHDTVLTNYDTVLVVVASHENSFVPVPMGSFPFTISFPRMAVQKPLLAGKRLSASQCFDSVVQTQYARGGIPQTVNLGHIGVNRLKRSSFTHSAGSTNSSARYRGKSTTPKVVNSRTGARTLPQKTTSAVRTVLPRIHQRFQKPSDHGEKPVPLTPLNGNMQVSGSADMSDSDSTHKTPSVIKPDQTLAKRSAVQRCDDSCVVSLNQTRWKPDSPVTTERKQQCGFADNRLRDKEDRPVPFLQVFENDKLKPHKALDKTVSLKSFKKKLEALEPDAINTPREKMQDTELFTTKKHENNQQDGNTREHLKEMTTDTKKTHKQKVAEENRDNDGFPFKEFYTSRAIHLNPEVFDIMLYHYSLLEAQDMTNELARYGSFAPGFLESAAKAWLAPYTKSNGWIAKLAETGLYLAQLDNGFSIRCAFCDLVVSDSSTFQHGNPRDTHRQLSPNCPLLTGQHTDNKPLSQFWQTTGREYLKERFQGAGNQQRRHASKDQREREKNSDKKESRESSSGRVEGPSDQYRLPPPAQRSEGPTASVSQISVQQQFTSLPANSNAVAQNSGPTPLQRTSHSSLASSPAATLAPQAQNHSPDIPQAASFQTQIPNQSSPSTQASSQPQGSAPNSASSHAEHPESSSTGENTPASSSTPPRQVVTYSQLGIYTQQPKRPDMVVMSIRSGTYSGWIHSQTHTPDEMAEAGFYYTGHNDLVRCFYCKGGLKSWAPHLRPWVEHARFFPQCPYVNQVKGRIYVDAVQELHNEHESISEQQVEAAIARRSKSSQEHQAAETLESSASSTNLEEGGAVGGAVGGVSTTVGRQAEVLYTDSDSVEDLRTRADELENRNRAAIEERMCKICQVSEVNILFLPCGHLVSCAHCAPALRTCAVCRQTVKGRVRVLMNENEQ